MNWLNNYFTATELKTVQMHKVNKNKVLLTFGIRSVHIMGQHNYDNPDGMSLRKTPLHSAFMCKPNEITIYIWAVACFVKIVQNIERYALLL